MTALAAPLVAGRNASCAARAGVRHLNDGHAEHGDRARPGDRRERAAARAGVPHFDDGHAGYGDRARPGDNSERAAGHACEHVSPRLTEADLFTIWRGQRFPAGALVTRDGVPVHAVFQGRPGRGPGPDFRGAVIAGPSGLAVRGDIELHVRASSFYAHGHDEDTAYARVILHVVFEDDTCEDTALPGGGTAPVVALQPWVARRAGELERWLQRPLLWQEPCGGALDRLGAAGVAAALDAEGDRRLEARVRTLAGMMAREGREQALYAALLEALGYGGNAGAMRDLARLLPWARLSRALAAGGGGVDVAEASLLGCAGLLPPADSEAAHPYVQRLWRRFAGTGLPSLASEAWKTRGVRPENQPARRLVAGSRLLASEGGATGLLARAADAGTVACAIAMLCVEGEGYWRDHYDTASAACRLPPSLLGRSRAIEILLNVAVPAAIAGGEARRARELYAALPRPARYGATRYLEDTVNAARGGVRVNARRAQGLLALHRDWCTQGGCGRCPLS
jgi:hypothetical protein